LEGWEGAVQIISRVRSGTALGRCLARSLDWQITLLVMQESGSNAAIYQFQNTLLGLFSYANIDLQ